MQFQETCKKRFLMKKFGLIGGTSWHSTMEYYSLLNSMVNEIHSDNTNPPLYIVNVNQKQIHEAQNEGKWDDIRDIFTGAAKELESLNVEGIAFCANTPHKVYQDVQDRINVPILHIADAIGKTITDAGHSSAGLLGTIFTMEGEFIRNRLQNEFGISTCIPPAQDRKNIQELFLSEFTMGIYTDQARDYFLKLISDLNGQNAQTVILGCTEFPLLVRDAKTPVPLVDSVRSHAEAIVTFIMQTDI